MPIKHKIVFYLPVVQSDYQKEKRKHLFVVQKFPRSSVKRCRWGSFQYEFIMPHFCLTYHKDIIPRSCWSYTHGPTCQDFLSILIASTSHSTLNASQSTVMGNKLITSCRTARAGSSTWGPQYSHFCFFLDPHQPCFLRFELNFCRRLSTWQAFKDKL